MKPLGVPYVVNTVGDDEVANTVGNDEVANTVGDNEGIKKGLPTRRNQHCQSQYG